MTASPVPEALEVRGFVVAAWEEPAPYGQAARRVFATARLDDGRSCALVLAPAPSAIYVAAGAEARARAVLNTEAAAWTEMAGRELGRFAIAGDRLDEATRRLGEAGVAVLHVERARAADALHAAGVIGPIAIRGAARPGQRVDLVFDHPVLAPGAGVPALGWLAIDLETDRAGTIVAASLAGAGGAGEVLLVGAAPPAPGLTCVPDERALLEALIARIRARDPDVITGWSVIDFDLRVLAARCTDLRIPLDLGRTPGVATVREREGGRWSASVPGRVVLDALRLVRASGERLEDQSLDGVAREVLGTGKTVVLRGEAKLAELDRLRAEEPGAFAAYCLRDAELVLAILRTTGLDVLTARRAALTGVGLELAWTSIPAFEQVYGAALRARHVIPPPRATAEVSGAAGGTVLEAEAGLFANVLVFDFRSLYPSLMRTFRIDPLGHARAEARPRPGDIVAPNGARFDRDEGILPAILSTYAREREAALAAGDDTAAFVYKILQNSFYGVLGSGGCRYGRTELAGAITSFGRRYLLAAQAWFEARGHHVLYGDTDSVFVLAGVEDTADHAQLTGLGRALADALNAETTAAIEREFGVPSYLALRCEKAYRRFLIARLRSDPRAEARGRAKGYAGLRLAPDDTTEVEVRGMEAVRSDVTPLARRFQVELMRLLFTDAGPAALRAYCDATARALTRGELDHELIYSKVLRRPAADYDSETPPVRAARLLGWTTQRGRIEYVMTRAGAEPLEARTAAAIDHAHYREKQLLPIARAIAEVLGEDADAWLGSAQLGLFGRASG